MKKVYRHGNFNGAIHISLGELVKFAVVLLGFLTVLSFSSKVWGQQATVSGVVKDASTNDPLAGVNIKVKGTTTGAATDVNGKYSLNVSSLQDTLVFLFIGYQTKTVPINGKHTVNVNMPPKVFGGQQLVVIGYGQQKQEDLTSSVAQVGTKELTEATSANIGQALQGQVAGAQVIQQGGGVPGGLPVIHIRGINSINTSGTPLYVVDGFVGVQNVMTTLNPKDIASLSVLKGPSATAIYGARGANGVVVITTKKGQKGPTQVTYDGSTSVGIMQRHMFAATADQLMYIYAQSMTNADKYSTGTINRNKDFRACCATGKTFAQMPWLFKQVPQGSYIIPLEGNDGNYYAPRFHSNWENKMFNPSVSNDQHLEIQGGGDRGTYSLGLGYTNNNGMMRKSYFRRYNGRATGDIHVFDWFDVKTQINFSKNKNTHDTGILRSTTEVWSFLPVKYPNNPDIYGHYAGRWGTNADFPIGEQWYNPVFRRHENVGYDNLDATRGLLKLIFDITDNLTFKTNFGIAYSAAKNNDYQGKLYGGQGSATIDQFNNLYWQSQNYFTYDNTFGKANHLTAMLGFVWSQRSYQNSHINNTDFFNNFYKWHNIGVGAASKPDISSADGDNELNSYFLRLHYDYNHKYLITATGRIDGSSRFGENDKYGFFPSVGVAWNIANENFLSNVDFISTLKLRGEAGITGNQEIGNYVTQANISANSNIVRGDGTVVGLYPATLGNPNLHWEETKEYDIGANIGLWNNRINFAADYYYKKTTGMLLYVPTPESTTRGSSIQNFGAMQNLGWGLVLKTLNFTSNNFQWNTRITASSNHNKILKLGPNGAPIYTNLSEGYPGSVYMVGEPVGAYFTLVRKGVWSTEQAAEAARYGLKPGDLHYADLNHDGQISLPEDGKITGTGFPLWTIDFNNQFNYKNFDLGFDIRFSIGGDKYFVHESAEDRQLVSGGLNTVLNAWRPDHQNTVIAQMRGGNQGDYYQALNDSHDVYNDNYIKGAHATLGYTFSGHLIQSAGIQHLRIYVKAQKFFVYTHAYGYNVEGSSLDQIRSRTPGEDKYEYPTPSTYSFGINLKF
jgi:TonB-linked SusC/RagA family outer membrane protein